MRARPDSSGDGPRDLGATLVELVVAIGLFGAFSTVLLGFALSTAEVTEGVRARGDVTDEARLAIERMSRELRQASAVEAVATRPVPGGRQPTAVTVWVDFDGDGARSTSASDPEVLTYRWEPVSGRLTLTANDAAGTAVTRPVLAEVVTRFDLQLASSLFEADADGNGTTTWQELDAATTYGGNANGLPDGAELERVDLVGLVMTVRDAGAHRDFAMRADLRNQDGH